VISHGSFVVSILRAVFVIALSFAFRFGACPAEAADTSHEIAVHNVAFALVLSVKCPEWKLNLIAVTEDAGDVTGPLLTQEVDKAAAQIKTISNPCELAGALFGPKGGLARNWLTK